MTETIKVDSIVQAQWSVATHCNNSMWSFVIVVPHQA